MADEGATAAVRQTIFFFDGFFIIIVFVAPFRYRREQYKIKIYRQTTTDYILSVFFFFNIETLETEPVVITCTPVKTTIKKKTHK